MGHQYGKLENSFAYFGAATVANALRAREAARELVDDYVTDVDTRCALFDDFRARCAHVNRSPNAASFAVFMVAPLAELRGFLRGSPECLSDGNRLSTLLSSISHGIESYVAKPPPPGKKVQDGRECLFSNTPDAHLTRIFPLATLGSPKYADLCDLIALFWGSDKRCELLTDRHTHRQDAANRIPMSRQFDYLFHQGRFALKPLRKTPEGVVVQWHWLNQSHLFPHWPSYDTYGTFRDAQLMDQSGGDGGVRGGQQAEQIRHGQAFLLRAGEDRPDWALLEMQWDLQRMVAICGAGDPHEGFGEYSARIGLYNPGARNRMRWVRYLGDKGIELSSID